VSIFSYILVIMSPLLGIWYIHFIHSSEKWERFYLYSDICGESIVDGQQRPLLRKLPATSFRKLANSCRSTILCPYKEICHCSW
jgi:hypothetical protein